MTDTDILAFLKARLDEDEAHAQKDLWALDRATPGTWQPSYGYNLPYSLLTDGNDREIARFVSSAGRLPDGAEDLHAADALLVGRLVRSARARAERVLREVEAKRRVLERHRPVEVMNNDGKRVIAHECSTCVDDYRDGSLMDWPCPEVIDLASVWSDHPDYDPSWSADG